MKSIKYLVVLACMTLGLANVAMAQVYNSEVMFFTSVKSNTSDYHVIDVVKIIDGNKLYIWGRSNKKLVKELQKSENYYDNFPSFPRHSNELDTWGLVGPYLYDEESSTTERYVYRQYNNGRPTQYCKVISKDLSTLISVEMTSAETYDKAFKNYYVRVSKEDYLVPGFINE